jgi:phosphatidylglycerophosphatase A
LKKIILFFATGFGSGYFPVFPGTVGSAVGVGVFFLLRLISLSPVLFFVNTVTISILGVWVSWKVEEYLEQKDPRIIVIDEIAGQLVTLSLFFFVPASGYYIIAGFVIFRIFDIFKPFPIRRLERIPYGWGVVFDDLMAGIYSLAVMIILYWGFNTIL